MQFTGKESGSFINIQTLYPVMKVLDGYRTFLEKSDDENLKASKDRDGVFFIFRSIEAWKEEKCKEEDIPAKELVRNEYTKNRFLAHP